MESIQNDLRPHVSIIDTNTLAIIGLRQILQEVMPMMVVEGFNSLEELKLRGADSFVHYFVSVNIVLENRAFFEEKRMKTIVLTTSMDTNTQASGFHSLCVNVAESELVRSLLMLEQRAHAHGKNMPDLPKPPHEKVLSNREIEVLSLIVQGHINKEIADMLNISITTVITHRKNILSKLGVKSVSALTIYAVMHGYVDITDVKG